MSPGCVHIEVFCIAHDGLGMTKNQTGKGVANCIDTIFPAAAYAQITLDVERCTIQDTNKAD